MTFLLEKNRRNRINSEPFLSTNAKGMRLHSSGFD